MLKKHISHSIVLLTTLACNSAAFASAGYYYDSNQYTPTKNSAVKPFHMNKARYEAYQDRKFKRAGDSSYLYGGYYFGNSFLDNNTKTLINAPSRIVFNSNDFAKKSNNIEVGFGKQLGQNIDLQLAYIHQLSKSKNAIIGIGTTAINPPPPTPTPAKTTISMQGIKTNLLYIINPDDQFKVAPMAGFSVESIDQKIETSSATYKKDLVEINFNIGFEVAYYLTKSLALRIDSTYVIGSNAKRSDGQLTVFAGASYIL